MPCIPAQSALGRDFHVIIPEAAGEARPAGKVRYRFAFINIFAAADSRANRPDGRENPAPAKASPATAEPTDRGFRQDQRISHPFAYTIIFSSAE
jgi:hypothetical protein